MCVLIDDDQDDVAFLVAKGRFNFMLVYFFHFAFVVCFNQSVLWLH